MSISNKITYKDAGVDIEAGDQFVERIKEKVRSTYGPRVMSGVGGFAALYKMHGGKLLATGTDGVGTKVKLAQALNKHDTVGVDLVAMCVNDIICTGATPLFFLDYLATGKLDLAVSEAIIAGIVDGCKQSECALIGGETAEMPGVYADGVYDLAGFAVGEVDEKAVFDGSKVKQGDTLIALASSGIHSNGFSLVRRLVKEHERGLMEACLTPTRIYWPVVKEIMPLVNGMAHITGGGLGNIPRMNEKFDYVLDVLPKVDEIPHVFGEMINRSGLDGKELYETFNMGMGFVVATSEPDKVIAALKNLGQTHWKIGHVATAEGVGNMAIVRAGGQQFEC
jgi:phosphoribosylformylglycinamidine cyclo-ligase